MVLRFQSPEVEERWFLTQTNGLSFFFYLFFIFIFIFFLYYAFIVSMSKKIPAASAMERTKPINQNHNKRNHNPFPPLHRRAGKLIAKSLQKSVLLTGCSNEKYQYFHLPQI